MRLFWVAAALLVACGGSDGHAALFDPAAFADSGAGGSASTGGAGSASGGSLESGGVAAGGTTAAAGAGGRPLGVAAFCTTDADCDLGWRCAHSVIDDALHQLGPHVCMKSCLVGSTMNRSDQCPSPETDYCTAINTAGELLDNCMGQTFPRVCSTMLLNANMARCPF